MAISIPQLIGSAEKALNVLLDQVLDGTNLTEQHWVTLRLAQQNAPDRDLATFVNERAHFDNALSLVTDLSNQGLITGNTLSPAGHELMDRLQRTIDARTAPLWAGLMPDDVEATARVLTTVADRARAQISMGQTHRATR